MILQQLWKPVSHPLSEGNGDVFLWKLSQACKAVFGASWAAQSGSEIITSFVGFRERWVPVVVRSQAPRLHDRTVEETFAAWRNNVRTYTYRTCTLSCNRHLIRITAKCANVALHPLQCCSLILEPCISSGPIVFSSQFWQSKETE